MAELQSNDVELGVLGGGNVVGGDGGRSSMKVKFFKGFKTYVWDWLVVVVILVLWLISDALPKPRERAFSVGDLAISYPFLQDTVSNTVLGIVCFVIPIVAVIVGSGIRGRMMRKKWDFVDLHLGLLTALFGLLTDLLITEVLKVSVGRKRPDFIGRCQVDWNIVAGAIPGQIAITGGVNVAGLAPGPTGMFYPTQVCTTVGSGAFYDGLKSFPSGHASLSFASATFMFLYIGGVLKMFKDPKQGWLWKLFLAGMWYVGAMIIAATRYTDNRHHSTDLFCGAILGSALMTLSYFYYYPGLVGERVGKGWSR